MNRTALLLPLLLAACATGPDRATVLNGLVGQDETSLVRQLGVPTRTADTPGHRFLAYTERRADYIPGGPFFGGFGYGGYGGFGYGGAFFPPEVIDRQCETTFDLVGGRVQSWSLRGNSCDA